MHELRRALDIPSHRNRATWPAIVATLIGNWFEFFDFLVYALFAVNIGRQFFPVASSSGQLMLSVATFGAGFIMRPLGGIVIGAYADRAGRKAALTLTIVLMAIGTGVLGLTPPYARIGIAAPVIIVLGRLVQGFSAGGEVGAATTYLVEIAPAGRRGLYASGQGATQALATLCASLMGFGLSSALSPAQMDAWGFRVPFLFGVLIGPVGLYIRRNLDETAIPASERERSRDVLTSLYREHFRLVMKGIFAICGATISVYIISHYMTTFALHTLGLPPSTAMLASVVAGAAGLVGCVFGGWLSDRAGRRRVMVTGRLLFLLAVYPAFLLITSCKTAGALLPMIAVLAVLNAMSSSVANSALPECFPRAHRTTGLSVTYAISVTVFGGSAQLVATWLLARTGNAMALAWYVMVASVISLCALITLRPPNEQLELD